MGVLGGKEVEAHMCMGEDEVNGQIMLVKG